MRKWKTGKETKGGEETREKRRERTEEPVESPESPQREAQEGGAVDDSNLLENDTTACARDRHNIQH